MDLALELGVSLTLPDLIQAIAARSKNIFNAAAVIVGLAHGDKVEAVILRSDLGTISERSSLTRLTPAITASCGSANGPIQSLDAARVFDAKLLSEFRWEQVTLA